VTKPTMLGTKQVAATRSDVIAPRQGRLETNLEHGLADNDYSGDR
jgi:hypothetical protein